MPHLFLSMKISSINGGVPLILTWRSSFFTSHLCCDINWFLKFRPQLSREQLVIQCIILDFFLIDRYAPFHSLGTLPFSSDILNNISGILLSACTHFQHMEKHFRVHELYMGQDPLVFLDISVFSSTSSVFHLCWWGCLPLWKHFWTLSSSYSNLCHNLQLSSPNPLIHITCCLTDDSHLMSLWKSFVLSAMFISKYLCSSILIFLYLFLALS